MDLLSSRYKRSHYIIARISYIFLSELIILDILSLVDLSNIL